MVYFHQLTHIYYPSLNSPPTLLALKYCKVVVLRMKKFSLYISFSISSRYPFFHVSLNLQRPSVASHSYTAFLVRIPIPTVSPTCHPHLPMGPSYHDDAWNSFFVNAPTLQIPNQRLYPALEARNELMKGLYGSGLSLDSSFFHQRLFVFGITVCQRF